MSRPAPRVLRSGGGWRHEPPIAREEAEKVLGTSVPPEAWDQISEAFRLYGEELEHLRSPTPKQYARSVEALRGQAKKLEKTLKTLKEDREMLSAIELAVMRDRYFYRSKDFDFGDLVRRLAGELNSLQLALLHADELAAQAKVQSEGQAKREHLRRVQAALAGIGVNTKPPPVFNYEKGDYRIQLNPFAELVQELGMHRGSNAALSEWLAANLDRELF